MISSKYGKLQNIDFLLTKPIETYQYRIKPSDISFGFIAICVATGHPIGGPVVISIAIGAKLEAVYLIPYQYPSMRSVQRKSIF